MHPCLPQNELKEYCDAKGILLTAYSPFGVSALVRFYKRNLHIPFTGQGNRLFFDDSDFISVAKAHGAAVAQVAVAWALQRNTSVIPKSANPERTKTNITVRRLAYIIDSSVFDS